MGFRAGALCLIVLAGSGCFPSNSCLPIVPNSPMANPSGAVNLEAFHVQATEAVARRVDAVGGRILAANPNLSVGPDLPVKPTFQVIGSTPPEICHRCSTIFISEGLVNRCPDDDQLAALLCLELGKMVSQCEAQAKLRARRLEQLPPTTIINNSDMGGIYGPPDGARITEIFKAEQGSRPSGILSSPLAPPDPKFLGCCYLTRAGFKPASLETVAPLLREADRNTTMEKLLNGGPVRPWVQ